VSDTAIKLTFYDPGDFVAESRAVAALEDCGFSVGHMQAHAPRGIPFGCYDIQKWKNLNAEHRRALHGLMNGDYRNGPVTVEIFDSAPDEAKAVLGGVSASTVERRYALAELPPEPFSVDPSQVQLLEQASAPTEHWQTVSPEDLGRTPQTQGGQGTPYPQQSRSNSRSEGKP
jgi:hypothetical protein